jgi:hypothetical protein
MCVSSLFVANRAIPTSMPMAVVEDGNACATSRSVWIDTNHLPPLLETASIRIYRLKGVSCFDYTLAYGQRQ